jgi:CheY-like chemotaxis protein
MKAFDSVCVIDDDVVYRFALKCLLETWDLSTNFSEFTDGADALTYIKAHAHDADALPDVVFLDINMPVMNGFNFLDEYGKIKNTLAKDMRIYLVSSTIADETRARAQNHPLVQGYIIKPLPVEALQEIVKEAA